MTTFPPFPTHEYQVVFLTRIGMMCGTNDSTPEQVAIAKAEADETLKEQP